MGAGKSLYGVRNIVGGLLQGKYCVTNVELREDAFERIAHKVARYSKAKQSRLIDRLGAQYIYTEDLYEARNYRLPGTGEARGLLVWDESHNDLNNRDWRESENRKEILKWGTQLRKLGFLGLLLSQHADNTDVALRRICNYVVRLQNQREQMRVLGLRVTPWPLFLASWYPAHVPIRTQKGGLGVQPIKVERYFLDWHRHLYDTFGIFHGLDSNDEGGTDNLIHLPDLSIPSSRKKRGSISSPSGVPVLRIASPSGGSRKPTSPALSPTSESAG